MYIPAFWVGVVATVLFEIAILIIALVVSFAKEKKNKKR